MRGAMHRKLYHLIHNFKLSLVWINMEVSRLLVHLVNVCLMRLLILVQ